MIREHAREIVITRLKANKTLRSKEGIRISCKVLPSHISGDPIILYQVVGKNHEVYDYFEEELAEAVDKFLDLTEAEWKDTNTEKRITIDADTLRKQNHEEAERRYNLWCEDSYDRLAEIERQILQANKDGLRTIVVEIAQEDSTNYKRFFKERHFEVCCRDSAERADKKEKALLKLDWSGKPKLQHRRTDRNTDRNTESGTLSRSLFTDNSSGSNSLFW